MANIKYFKYGMRLRGFAPLCQPLDGLVTVEDGRDGYYNILVYKRMLTEKEISDYELDDLNDLNFNKMHRRRRELGLSLDELASKVGASRRTLEKYERTGAGINQCRAEVAVKIADVLGCSVKDLLE